MVHKNWPHFSALIFLAGIFLQKFPQPFPEFFWQIRKGSEFWVSWHGGGGAVVRKSRTIELILRGSSHTRSLSLLRIGHNSLQAFTVLFTILCKLSQFSSTSDLDSWKVCSTQVFLNAMWVEEGLTQAGTMVSSKSIDMCLKGSSTKKISIA